MELCLITHNPNKIREFRQMLEPKYLIEVLELEYPELRSDDPCEIVELAAKQLAEKLQKNVIVEDSGFFIESVDGFPGTCTAYIHKRIGNKGFLKLMKSEKKRKVHYKSAIGFCIPGEKAVSFLGIEEGKMSMRESGKNGWGQDPIFIPKGKSKTYGQIRKQGDVNVFRRRAIERFLDYLDNF